MAKDIAKVGNTRLTQFFGGVERGICLQVTVSQEAVTNWDEPFTTAYAELTREQVVELAFELENWLKDTQDKFPPMAFTQETEK